MFSDVSNMTDRIDGVFVFIVGISLVLLLAITLCMIYFAVKYRKSKNPNPQDIEGSLYLEITWVVVPTIIVFVMFFYGLKVYQFMQNIPPDAFAVKVTGRQWSWLFEYPNGTQSDELRVPIGRPVSLAIRSADVIHSFYVPAFRIKQDAVPGTETRLWFSAKQAGSYDIFCSMYCGEGHSHMLSKLIALPQADFDRWYAAQQAPAGVGKGPGAGLELVKANGCLGCHSTDGSRIIGPSFKGLFGSRVAASANGVAKQITIDEAQVRRHVIDPKAEVMNGYPEVMPSFKGVLSDQEVGAVVEFLKSLKG